LLLESFRLVSKALDHHPLNLLVINPHLPLALLLHLVSNLPVYKLAPKPLEYKLEQSILDLNPLLHLVINPLLHLQLAPQPLDINLHLLLHQLAYKLPHPQILAMEE